MTAEANSKSKNVTTWLSTGWIFCFVKVRIVTCLHYRNKPHTYPDLVASDESLPGIEIKTALLKNSPKGHQPKPGYYLTYRYCLTDENGNRNVGEEELWDTVTIWEVKMGYLSEDDFSCSNTDGDSGKTAVIRTSSLNKMPLLYFDSSLVPYKHTNSKPYNGYN